MSSTLSFFLSFLTSAPDECNRWASRLGPFTFGESAPRNPLARRPYWPLSRFERCDKKENLLSLPIIELRFLVGRPARNLATMPTELSRQNTKIKCDSSTNSLMIMTQEQQHQIIAWMTLLLHIRKTGARFSSHRPIILFFGFPISLHTGTVILA
jgi:hypothetical protein